MAAARHGIGNLLMNQLRSTARLSLLGALAAACWQSPARSVAVAQDAAAQGAMTQGAGSAAHSPAYYTDPTTGIVYQKVHRTIERPVMTTEMTTQESTVYRPDTVVDVAPETRTLYTPVVSYNWEPRWRGRWNPFMQPTLQYEHVPTTRWEARNETVERRQSRTNWVAETRRVEVPRQVMRIQREEKVDYQAVGRVAPQASQQPVVAAQDAATAALAARLRPIDQGAQVVPFGYGGAPAGYGQNVPPGGYGFQSAASMSLPLASTTRTRDQQGMQATELQSHGNRAHTTPLPPANVARGSSLQPWWR